MGDAIGLIDDHAREQFAANGSGGEQANVGREPLLKQTELREGMNWRGVEAVGERRGQQVPELGVSRLFGHDHAGALGPLDSACCTGPDMATDNPAR